MTRDSLAGIGVLVTRPLHQSSALVSAIEAAGGEAILFPVIRIEPRSREDIEVDAEKLPAPDITVFVSGNAVEHGLTWADGVVAAVGPATAAALERSGLSVDVRPADGFDSESLLAEPALRDVAGKKIRIVRGTGGRELLARTLGDRGANVDYLEVYSRCLPEYLRSEIDELERRWQRGDVAVVTVMSVESLRNLIDLLPESALQVFAKTPLVTPAARVIKEALDRLPDCPTTLASGPGADEMVRAIATIGPHTSGNHS